MPRLFVPGLGPTDGRRLLPDPGRQWEPGKSALELAVCWESARKLRGGCRRKSPKPSTRRLNSAARY